MTNYAVCFFFEKQQSTERELVSSLDRRKLLIIATLSVPLTSIKSEGQAGGEFLRLIRLAIYYGKIITDGIELAIGLIKSAKWAWEWLWYWSDKELFEQNKHLRTYLRINQFNYDNMKDFLDNRSPIPADTWRSYVELAQTSLSLTGEILEEMAKRSGIVTEKNVLRVMEGIKNLVATLRALRDIPLSSRDVIYVRAMNENYKAIISDMNTLVEKVNNYLMS